MQPEETKVIESISMVTIADLPRQLEGDSNAVMRCPFDDVGVTKTIYSVQEGQVIYLCIVQQQGCWHLGKSKRPLDTSLESPKVAKQSYHSRCLINISMAAL